MVASISGWTARLLSTSKTMPRSPSSFRSMNNRLCLATIPITSASRTAGATTDGPHYKSITSGTRSPVNLSILRSTQSLRQNEVADRPFESPIVPCIGREPGARTHVERTLGAERPLHQSHIPAGCVAVVSKRICRDAVVSSATNPELSSVVIESVGCEVSRSARDPRYRIVWRQRR